MQQQAEHVLDITARNGDRQSIPMSGDGSAEDLDGSEKIPLTALEVETLEADADTIEMTSINTKK